MFSNTSHIQCLTSEQFRARFMELDSFHKPLSNANVIREIETRFKAMARAYAMQAEHLRNWVGNGNRLPEVYR